MQRIALLNYKGGVGKTSLTFHLAGVLVEADLRVLVCDCDNSGNVSSLLAPGHEQRSESIADIFADSGIQTQDLVIETTIGGVDLIPSDMRLREYNQAVNYQTNPAAYYLTDALSEVDSRYDMILFDCPPEPHVSGLAALLASDGAVIPITADESSLANLDVLEAEIAFAQANGNRGLSLLGYVLSNYDANVPIERTWKDGIFEQYADKMFRTVIPCSDAIKSARAYHQPITQYRPKSPAADAMRAFANEVIERHTERSHHEPKAAA